MKTKSISLGKVRSTLPFFKERLSEAQLSHHVYVVGASGYGKTVLLSHILKHKIETGSGLLYIDLKGDRETIEKIQRMAKESNREADVQMFSISDPEHSSKYNIILQGSATGLRDRIMMSLTWTEEYYKNQAGSFLLKTLTGFCWLRDNASEGFDIGKVLRCAEDPSELEKAFLRIRKAKAPERIEKLMLSAVEFLGDRENYKSLQGLRAQLESLVHSEFGPLLVDPEGIELFKAVQLRKVVMIFLDTRRFGETARSLGRFILQDLKATSARIDAEIAVGSRHPFAVVIDEFADLAQEDFIGFLDRARSSRMQIVVAHQEVCDLSRISEEFAGRLIGNTSTMYAFLQKRPESAELIAGIAGTRTVVKETKQVDSWFGFNVFGGKKSLRETEEYVIHPNFIKSLSVGECVVVKKYPRAEAKVVDVFREGT